MKNTPRTGALTDAEARVLAAVYTHRIVATGHIHRWFGPDSPNGRYPLYCLESLRERGLLANTGRRGRRELLWHTTTLGAAVAEDSGRVQPRTWRLDPAKVATIDPAHTLAINDVGTEFVRWAHQLGDECGPADWNHEVAHHSGIEGKTVARQTLIADAVLRYTAHRDSRRIIAANLIEVDRGTMTVQRLADKLAAYVRYRNYGEDHWRQIYPGRFPDVLIVLDGPDPAALLRRIGDLRGTVADTPRLAAADHYIAAAVTTLDLLRQHGPFGPVFAPLPGDYQLLSLDSLPRPTRR